MRPRAAATITYAVADQAVSSATNFLAFGLFIRRASLAESGQYAVLLSLLLLAQLLCRQAVLVPIVAGQQVLDESRVRSLWLCVWKQVVGIAGAGALGIGIIGASAGLGRLVPIFVAVTVPIVAFEAYRFLLLTTRRTRRALVLDVVWLSVVAATIPAAALGVRGGTAALVAWGIGSSVALLIGLLSRSPNDVEVSIERSRPRKRDRGVLVAEALVERGSLSLALLIVSGAVGVGEVGRLEVARQAFAPINVVTLGLLPVLFGSLVNSGRQGNLALTRVFPYIVAIGAMTLGWTAFLLSHYGDVAGRMFGPLWDTSSALVVPVSVGIACIAVQSTARIVMHAHEQYVASLVARTVASLSLVGTAVYVAVVGGSVGLLFSCGLLIGAFVCVAFGVSAVRGREPVPRST